MEEIETGGVGGQLASVVPWMVGCGNHDCLYDNSHKPPWAGSILSAGRDGGQCGVPYNARFKMPGDPAQIDGWHESRNGTRNNLFYSFDVRIRPLRDALIGARPRRRLGATRVARGGPRGRRPLPHALRARRPPPPRLHVDEARHQAAGDEGAAEAGARAAAPPAPRERVFAGHYHQYERSCPIARNAAPLNGTVHVTAGIAGLQHHDDFASPAPSWAKVQVVDTFGYTRVTVVNATRMKVQAINSRERRAFEFGWRRREQRHRSCMKIMIDSPPRRAAPPRKWWRSTFASAPSP